MAFRKKVYDEANTKYKEEKEDRVDVNTKLLTLFRRNGVFSSKCLILLFLVSNAF